MIKLMDLIKESKLDPIAALAKQDPILDTPFVVKAAKELASWVPNFAEQDENGMYSDEAIEQGILKYSIPLRQVIKLPGAKKKIIDYISSIVNS